MVWDLLKVFSTSMVRSVNTYVDVLEYCLSDVEFRESSNCSGADTLTDLSNSDSVCRVIEECISSFISIPNVHRVNDMSTQSAAS